MNKPQKPRQMAKVLPPGTPEFMSKEEYAIENPDIPEGSLNLRWGTARAAYMRRHGVDQKPGPAPKPKAPAQSVVDTLAALGREDHSSTNEEHFDEDDGGDFITQEMLDKDWREVADENRPVPPLGYRYRHVKSDDGRQYEVKLRLISEPVHVYDNSGTEDTSWMPHDITSHPYLRGMTLRWENPPSERNGTFDKAVKAGYTEVPASKLKNVYLGRHVEADRVYDGDMILMARPIEATVARQQHAAQVAKRIKDEIFENRGVGPGASVDDFPAGHEWESEIHATPMGGGGEYVPTPQERQTMQAEWRRNAEVGRNQFTTGNAPFQRRIINNREYREDPATGVLTPV